MAKLAITLALTMFLTQTAQAAQTSSGLGVGLTIGASSYTGNRSTRRLVVPAHVTKTEPAWSYTWNAAAISVKGAGFKQPRRIEKARAVYWFQAMREGANFRIAVSIASGKVVKIIRA